VTAQPDPYVRVYYRITDDPKFADVYDNDAALALWLRLLITADATWPAAAPLPQLDRDALTTLVNAGLVDLVGATRYRIHGLESERSKRTNKGTQMAAARWSGKHDAQAYAQASEPECTSITHSIAGPHAGPCSPSNSEPSRATPSNSEPSISTPADALDTYYRLTGSWPSAKVVPWINQMASNHGEEAVSKALAATWMEDPDRATLMSRCRDRLEREAHEREKAYERAEARRAERDQKQIEEMPLEKRRENMARLRESLEEVGLLPRTDA